MSRRLGIAAALICATTLTAGCAPDPDPTPTPTGFTSQAEAFAAAEKTYRAYVNALNNVDLTDPATFEDVYKWETGEALADEKKSLTGMHADGWIMEGDTEPGIASLRDSSTTSENTVVIHVCMDVGNVSVHDASGASLVSEDRPDVQPLDVTLVASSQSATGLVISRTAASEETCGT